MRLQAVSQADLQTVEGGGRPIRDGEFALLGLGAIIGFAGWGIAGALVFGVIGGLIDGIRSLF